MAETTSIDEPFRVGFFNTVPEADQAVRNLMAAGFSKDELAVICPSKFHEQFAPGVPRAQRPGSHTGEAIAEGGAVGAVLGGLALVATAVATGGVGVIPAIPVLLGGGALAGGFSGLIASDGYGKGIGEFYDEAVHYGKIVVGVHLENNADATRLARAASILKEAGGMAPTKK